MNRGSCLYRVDVTKAPDPLFILGPLHCPVVSPPLDPHGCRVCGVASDPTGLEISWSGKGGFFYSSARPGKSAVGALLLFRAHPCPGVPIPLLSPRVHPGPSTCSGLLPCCPSSFSGSQHPRPSSVHRLGGLGGGQLGSGWSFLEI